MIAALVFWHLAGSLPTSPPSSRVPDFRQDAEGWIASGLQKVKAEDVDGAIQDFTKAIELNPEYKWSYLNRALARVDQEDPEKAQADFSAAIRLDPQFLSAYVGRCLARLMSQDLSGASVGCDSMDYAG